MDKQRKGKRVVRFISTHPDEDHLYGLTTLDDHINIDNFYVVKNNATKDQPDEDFKRYKALRDGNKAFYLYQGCSRKWMNRSDEKRGGAGINIRWPVTSNKDFKKALADAAEGKSPNNISPVITYSLKGGVKMAWFGDLETTFMERIKGAVSWPEIDITFAPHHGRDGGKIPASIFGEMNPKIVVIGQAPSKHLNYYGSYNTITQNSAGAIYFECVKNWVHIYVGSSTYSVDFLEDKGANSYDYYLGSLGV